MAADDTAAVLNTPGMLAISNIVMARFIFGVIRRWPPRAARPQVLRTNNQACGEKLMEVNYSGHPT
jgi:hypothetical protein